MFVNLFIIFLIKKSFLVLSEGGETSVCAGILNRTLISQTKCSDVLNNFQVSYISCYVITKIIKYLLIFNF